MKNNENQLICTHCKTENVKSASFCNNCGKTLNIKGKAKQLGWKIVFYDLCLPGLGHYKIGRKVEAYFLMTAFLLSFTLYSIDSASTAMKVISHDIIGSSTLSPENLQKSIDARRSLYNSFLSWTYLIIWISAVANSIVIKLNMDKMIKESSDEDD